MRNETRSSGSASRARDRFVRYGSLRVGGWVSQADFALFARLLEWQDRRGVEGHFCEIGVFEGKRFLFFLLSLRPGEKAIAVDVFDDTEPRRDFEPVFRENVLRHAGSLDNVRVLRRDSATVRAQELLAAAGGSMRVFSVDGCHGASAVVNDLSLACNCLAPGGLIIVDDYFNETWPGVSEGTLRFLASEEGRVSGMVPFAIFSTKLILARGDVAAGYLDHLRQWRGPHTLTETTFLGHIVATLHVQPAPTRAMRLGSSRAWRLVRNTPIGRAVRWIRRALTG